MSLEKILIIGVALIIIGGIFMFANGVAVSNNEASGIASGNQAELKTNMGLFVFD